MEAFTTVTSVAATLPESNIDTDVIFPARFLILTVREGLGQYLFHDHRFLEDGSENPHFPLNIAPFRKSHILIAGDNFGCGSSREQAVWALKEYGVSVVIAPRFGEIFFNNCFKNAVLPIVLDLANVTMVQTMAATGAALTVDLEQQTITSPDQLNISFAIDAFRRDALLKGWDEITTILRADELDISAFEARQHTVMSWLYNKA